MIRAYELKYVSSRTFKEKANTLKNLKKFEKAIENLDNAKKVKPLPPDFWLYRGLTLFELKRFDEAMECYDEVLTNNSDDSTALYHKARAEMMADRKNQL